MLCGFRAAVEVDRRIPALFLCPLHTDNSPSAAALPVATSACRRTSTWSCIIGSVHSRIQPQHSPVHPTGNDRYSSGGVDDGSLPGADAVHVPDQDRLLLPRGGIVREHLGADAVGAGHVGLWLPAKLPLLPLRGDHLLALYPIRHQPAHESPGACMPARGAHLCRFFEHLDGFKVYARYPYRLSPR